MANRIPLVRVSGRLKELPSGDFLKAMQYCDIQTFLSSGTWTKPSGFPAHTLVLIEGLSGGASGAARATTGNAGGGGGGCFWRWLFYLDQLDATEAVTIGGDAAGVSGNTDGNPGGDVSFGLNISGGAILKIRGASAPGQVATASGNTGSSFSVPYAYDGTTQLSNSTFPELAPSAGLNAAAIYGLFNGRASTFSTSNPPPAPSGTQMGGGSGAGWSSNSGGTRTGSTGIFHSSVGGNSPGTGGGAGGNGTGLGAGGGAAGQGGTSGIGRKGYMKVTVFPFAVT